MQRFYCSTAGYIIDSSNNKLRRHGRVKDKPDWREKGDQICVKLSSNPDKISEILEEFKLDLE